MSTKPDEFANWPASIEPGWAYRAVVKSITDGDTLRMMIDQGLNDYTYQPIRIARIDAPELYTSDPVEREKGRAARAHLESICPPGTKCLIRTERDKESFARYIASLTLPDGRDVAEEMVLAGHAEYSQG
jgi:endonuclease YncB( thermonuclease family)